jgi:hypothetical protein
MGWVGLHLVAASVMKRFIATILALVVSSPAAASCDACKTRLTTRTGSYAIRVVKEAGNDSSTIPRMRVTIANAGSHPVLVGSPASAKVTLAFVTPRARGRMVVPAVPEGHARSIAPGSSFTFHVTYPYRLRRPGTYEFNVSFGRVDSNIVTYLVR